MTTAAARFAIKETASGDPSIKGPLYWNFTAWRYTHPEPQNLMDASAAARELDRLKASYGATGRKGDSLVIVDVLREQERGRVWGEAYRGVFKSTGYDSWDRATQNAHRPALKAAALAVAQVAVEVAGLND